MCSDKEIWDTYPAYPVGMMIEPDVVMNDSNGQVHITEVRTFDHCPADICMQEEMAEHSTYYCMFSCCCTMWSTLIFKTYVLSR